VRRTTLPALALALVLGAHAGVAQSAAPARGTVVTDTLWSQALGTRKALVVYLPPSYGRAEQRRFPVVYYLHGLGGNERNWTVAGRLDAVMDSLVARGMHEMIVVMPDGDDSWYTTWNALSDPGCQRDTLRKEPAATYCVSWPHYDDYVAHEVVAFVDNRYRTRADRAHRGIAGLSMGGYGAISLALRYPDVFAAAASHSGVVAPAYLPADSAGVGVADRVRELETVQGKGLWPSMVLAFGRDSTGWVARDPRFMARRMAGRRERLPAMRLDVGLDDRFLAENRAFHRTLTELSVSHVYLENSGKHDWDYWRAHVPESLTWLAGIVAR
jgi:S-formylglutathione hydrolase FrmB